MIEQMPLDLVNLLLFTIPGFFLVRFYKGASKAREFSDFEYLILSAFWGIIFITTVFRFFPSEKLDVAISNPYVGAIIFSLFAMIVGFSLKQITSELRRFQK